MKLLIVGVLTALCLTASGCSKDSEVKSFLDEWDSLTRDIVKKVDAGDLDGAQTALDAKKAGLRSKLTELQAAPNRVSADVLKEFDERFGRNQMKMTATYFNNWKKWIQSGDTEKVEKLKALFNDYARTFGTHREVS